MAIRQLVLSGRVQRALILVPKSVLVQWQEELYEKFILNIPRYDGSSFYDVFGRELKVPSGTNPWDAQPVFLASSHLAKRRERQEQLIESQPWHLIVVDEAHHARRKDFLSREQYRPNRLLELLQGTNAKPGLRDRTKGLLLLTATPMQIDPIVPFADVDWTFMLAMLRDFFATGGQWDKRFCEESEQTLGPVVWDQIKNLPWSSNSEPTIKGLDSAGRKVLVTMARKQTPLQRYVFRNTRRLLRVYHEKGLLKENVPYRDPKPEWVEMRSDEKSLYDQIEEYIRDHYQKYEAERKGLGFIMTVYRRRLTSSFYAIQKSLERRLEFLKGKDTGLTDDDTDQDDLETDVTELFQFATPESRKLFQGEIQYVEDFLAGLRTIGTDSKFQRLVQHLNEFLKRRDSVIVFTQYTDTMDYLRDKLRQVYGAQVACYSGRGGEQWNGKAWSRTSKENIKTAFREHTEVKILLCTESASEGLNLQTCGVLINYDMPWNPMRVEQRIGRIDRIGQVYQRVWVRNYFYDQTVEATIYQRLDDRIGSFENVVGELQPILSRVARAIESAVMASGEQRDAVIREQVEEINRLVKQGESSGIGLDSISGDAVEAPAVLPVPVTLTDLEGTIVQSEALGLRFRPHSTISAAHLLDWNGQDQEVTFNPTLFDEHPNTLILLSFGSDLLAELLEAVEPPASSDGDGRLARCRIESPVPVVGYYGASKDGQPEAILTFASLRKRLDEEPPPTLMTDQMDQVRARFIEAVEGLGDQDHLVAEQNHQAHVASLKEGIRQLLLLAAYVELAQTANRGLFDEGDDLPLDFSEQAIRRLKRHKIPFAGALKLVDVSDIRPRSDDPKYIRLRDNYPDVLTRRFEATRIKLGEYLGQLVQAQQISPPTNRAAGDHGPPIISLF